MYYSSPGYLHPGPITPWAAIGQNFLVKRVQYFILYQVVFLEQLPPSAPLQVDFGAIPASSTLASQSLQVPLEMDGFEMGQFRVKLLDDIALQVYEPQSINRFVVKNARARISRRSHKLDPYDAMTEMAVFQDEYPFVDVINPRAYALTQARASFYGFRYRLSPKKMSDGSQAAWQNIADIPVGVQYAAVMAEGFVGTGFVRDNVA